MDKKKLTIILSVLCAIALIVAIILIASPKDKEVIPPENTPITDTPNSEIPESDKVFVDGVRNDKETELLIVIDGETKGKVKAFIENSVFYVLADDLKTANVLTTDIVDGKMTIEKESETFVIEENKVTITRDISNDAAEEDSTTTDEEKEVSNTTEIEITPTYKVKDEKNYISERVMELVFNAYINDKAITVITGTKDSEITENSSKIEAVLRNETLVPFDEEDLEKLTEQLHNKSYTAKVTSYGPINESVTGEEIKNILFNAFGNEANIIYNKKAENKYIVMFDSGVASSLMNAILPSLSTNEVYANVRLLVETDESGNITNIYGDSYYIFDGRDIYYYITVSAS